MISIPSEGASMCGQSQMKIVCAQSKKSGTYKMCTILSFIYFLYT